MRLTGWSSSALVLMVLASACGDPFTQPACYNGPGCGLDQTPPVATITAPAYGTTVSCPFLLEVTATDNTDVLGVDFYLMDVKMDPVMVTAKPYRFQIDPTAVRPNPGAGEGSRELAIIAYDVAGNADTAYTEVYYRPPTQPCFVKGARSPATPLLPPRER